MSISHSKYNQPQNTLTVNPLSRPKGAYLFQSHLKGAAGRGGGGYLRWMAYFI